MPERTSSFSVKLQADLVDIRGALDSVRGELNRLRGDFDSWAKSATGSVDSVTASITRLSSTIASVPGLPGGGGGGIGGYGPSVGMGGGGGGGATSQWSVGGGGALQNAPQQMEGFFRRALRDFPIAGGLLSAGAGVASRLVGLSIGFGQEMLTRSVNLARQYQSSMLYGYGGVGDIPGASFRGTRFGMNAAEYLPFVHGIRQQLVPSLNQRGGVVGYSGTAEDLVMRLSIGTGANPQEIAAIMAQAQVGGRAARGRFGPGGGALPEAPGLTIMGLAAALTTFNSENGLSEFNLSLQDLSTTAQALTGILQTHTQVYTQLNESTMQFAQQGFGILAGMGRSGPIAQNILSSIVSGMAQPGGGEAGRALAYQAVGYAPGMDPFQARLRLESGNYEDIMNVFNRIEEQYGMMGPYRVMAGLSAVFNLSATQAQDAYRMFQQMRANPEMRGELTEEFSRLISGEFAPQRLIEEGATGRIGLLQASAGFENEMIQTGQDLTGVVAQIFDLQKEGLEVLRGILNEIERRFADGDPVEAIPGSASRRGAIRSEAELGAATIVGGVAVSELPFGSTITSEIEQQTAQMMRGEELVRSAGSAEAAEEIAGRAGYMDDVRAIQLFERSRQVRREVRALRTAHDTLFTARALSTFGMLPTGGTATRAEIESALQEIETALERYGHPIRSQEMSTPSTRQRRSMSGGPHGYKPGDDKSDKQIKLLADINSGIKQLMYIPARTINRD